MTRKYVRKYLSPEYHTNMSKHWTDLWETRGDEIARNQSISTTAAWADPAKKEKRMALRLAKAQAAGFETWGEYCSHYQLIRSAISKGIDPEEYIAMTPSQRTKVRYETVVKPRLQAERRIRKMMEASDV